VVLVGHGSYARRLLEAARTVVGALDAAVVDIEAGLARQQIRELLIAAMAEREAEGGVLLLVDLCGSTPCNVGLELLGDSPRAELLTGLSLAMLVKLATADPRLDARGLAAELKRSAQRSVQLGSDLLCKGAPSGC
jgi:mannose/fructose-specific phosphotransferase system component IIA